DGAGNRRLIVGALFFLLYLPALLVGVLESRLGELLRLAGALGITPRILRGVPGIGGTAASGEQTKCRSRDTPDQQQRYHHSHQHGRSIAAHEFAHAIACRRRPREYWLIMQV